MVNEIDIHGRIPFDMQCCGLVRTYSAGTSSASAFLPCFSCLIAFLTFSPVVGCLLLEGLVDFRMACNIRVQLY